MATFSSLRFFRSFVCDRLFGLVLCALLMGCEKTEAPLAQDSVYSVANGCYAIEGFEGTHAARYIGAGQTPEQFSFSADSLKTAARFSLRPSDLGVYLLFDTERRYFAASSSGDPWSFTRLSKLTSVLDKLDENEKSPAEWILQISARDPKRYQLQHYATGRFLSMSGLTDDTAKAAMIRLHPTEGCASFPELSIDATGAAKPRKWEDGDVYGIAEIHSHMLSNVGFGGGGVFHGAPFHRLGVEHALSDC